MELLTIGHGSLPRQECEALLLGARVEVLVDIRRAPGSRRHPQFSRAALGEWAPTAGVAYQWEEGLGGWRKSAPDSKNTALRNDSFRGYADYMRTPEFWRALDQVLSFAAARRTAVMCAESVYWRCHRRLVSDAAQLVREVIVLHLGHDGRLSRHRLTHGARRDGELVAYDGGAIPVRQVSGAGTNPC